MFPYIIQYIYYGNRKTEYFKTKKEAKKAIKKIRLRDRVSDLRLYKELDI